MGIKIYTYKDPFYIDKYSYWEEVKDAPHLCVSQTLVQGLIRKYKRMEFSYLFYIDTVIEEVYKEWFKSTETKIKQYIKVSEQVAKIDDEKIKRSFKFNQSKVLDAIRMVKELELDLNINIDRLSREQRVFIDILNSIQDESCFSIIDEYKSKEVKDIKNAMDNLIDKDIDKLHKNGKSIKEQEERLYLEKVKNSNHRLSKIVIHGVHRFDSKLFYFIKNIERMGIDIIFLINYDDEYKRIYETWKNVYKWTNKELIVEKINLDSEHQDIGIAIGKLLEGDFKKVNECYLNLYKVNVFDNLTSFSSSICAEYDKALEKSKQKLRPGQVVKPNQTLKNMDKQYYATNNRYINDILKTYYPEQFGEKQFLSYPIGQFILSIYNMWDNIKNTIKVNDKDIRECLIPIFDNTENNSSIIETYDKVKIYFKNKEYIDDIINSLKKLKSSISKINRDNDYKNLKKLSFYAVSQDDISILINAFIGIREIANAIFRESKVNRDSISYSKHYKKLLDIISSKIVGVDDISKREKDFVEEISAKLSTIENEEIIGSVEDINQTLHYYLNTRSKDEHLRWIVRNFEQADGGVLLSEDYGDKKYHYCFVSDKMMNPVINELLPWPININMLERFNIDNKYLDAVITSLREYKNFLRYSLFYACIFCKKDVEISYVKDCGKEEDQKLYFILDILGVSSKKINEDNELVKIQQLQFQPSTELDIMVRPSRIELEKAEICTYRYLMDNLMDENMYFSNEYHIKFYIIIMLFTEIVSELSRMDRSKINEDIIDTEVSKAIYKYIRYLPHLSEVDEADIKNKVKKDLVNHIKNADVILDQEYLSRKLEFLMASVKDIRNNEGENLIKGIFKKDLNNKKIINYLLDNRVKVEDINPLICEYCAQREICLEPFKMK